MSNTLAAANQDRKARLAQLKSLKRKQPPSTTDTDDPTDPPPAAAADAADIPPSSISHLLSGRNYDPTTRGPRLGFELDPSQSSSTPTLEARAAALSAAAKAELERERAAAEETPDGDGAGAGAGTVEGQKLDLFKLQPKKPNWDLKRELERRLVEGGVNVRTERAIAELVRERIQGAKGKDGAQAMGAAEAERRGAGEGGEDVGIEGSTLVEATKEREREDEEDARRERELDAELGE